LCGCVRTRGSVSAAKREGGIGEYTMINNVCLGKTSLFISSLADFLSNLVSAWAYLRTDFQLKPVFTIGLVSTGKTFCEYRRAISFEISVNIWTITEDERRSTSQRSRCGKYVYKFTRAQFAAFPSPLPGALNFLRADPGFLRHPGLNSYAQSWAEIQIQTSC